MPARPPLSPSVKPRGETSKVVNQESPMSESQQHPEGESIDLQPRQGYVVPRGIVHRTRAPDRAVILMVETASIVPTGDA
jgi:mannose-6-phosphate isomerase-like protein (cupin superfamily)